MAISKAMAHTTGANSVKQKEICPANKAIKRKREETAKLEHDKDESKSTYDPMNILEKDITAKKIKHDDSDVLLLDRLHGNNAIYALKEIQTKLESMKFNSNIEDPLIEFFQQGGTARDFLQILNQSDKIKHSDVVTVFHACEAILLHLGAQITSELKDEENDNESKNAKLQSLAVDLTREILQNHIKYLMMFLSDKNSAQQSITSLRLLTAMVAAGGPSAGKEVLIKVDFEHPNVVGLPARAIQIHNSDIRKCHLEFLVAFFVAGNSSVIKEFLEKNSTRNHLASLFPGFIYDEYDVVQLVISALHEKLLNNLAISKTAKMQLLGVHNLKYILALFGWKGPKGRTVNAKSKQSQLQSNEDNHEEDMLTEDDEVQQAELDNIRQLTKDFFIDALTSVKKGLVFFDSTCGTSGNNQNQLLQNILQNMTSYKPWKEKHMSLYISDIVIRSLAACPDQLRPYFTKALQPLWTPKENSPTWKLVVTFLRKIFDLQDPVYIVKSLFQAESNIVSFDSGKDTATKLVSNILCNIFCNDKIYREVINPALTSSSLDVSREGLKLFVVLIEKIEELFSNSVTSKDIQQQVIHRLSDKIVTFQVLKGLWKTELNCMLSNDEETDMEDSIDPLYLKMISRVYNFYWSYFPMYFNGNSDIILAFMQDVSQIQEKTKGNVDPAISYIQLLLLKRLASLSERSSIYNGTEILASQENLKVLVDWSTSERSEDLALETILRILHNSRMIDLKPRSMERLSIWFKSVNHMKDNKVKQNMIEQITNCLSKSLKCKDTLIQNFNVLMASYKSQDTSAAIVPDIPSEFPDENAFLCLMTNPDLHEMINFKDKMQLSDIDTDLNQDDLGPTEKPLAIELSPIELALIKNTEMQDLSPDYFSSCLYMLIAFQDKPKILCNLLFDKARKVLSNNMRNLVKSLVDQRQTSKTQEQDRESTDNFLFRQKIYRYLLCLKMSDDFQVDNVAVLQDSLQSIEDISTRKKIMLDILKQESINYLFEPFQAPKEINEMILDILKECNSEKTIKTYRDRFVSTFLSYFKDYNSPMWAEKNVTTIESTLQETMSVLATSNNDARVLFDKLKDSLPPVMKVAKEEMVHLRCVMSKLLASFATLDHSILDDRFITYVTNLMELIMAGTTDDKYNESFLSAINVILSSCPKMIEALSSVHISLAVKSNLQSSKETLVHLITNSDKFAKAFRKLVVKETNVIENLEKFLLASIPSLNYKADVKSKFVKEIRKVFQPEISFFLNNEECRLPNHAITTLLGLIKVLKNEYSIQFEEIDLHRFTISNIRQMQIANALFNTNDNDDEVKTLLLVPSLKIATAQLKAGFIEDDSQLNILFDIINERMEGVHSITSFYTNSAQNEVWNKFVKSVLKHSLKMVAPGTDANFIKRGSISLNTLNKLCKKLYGISNTRKKKTRGWKENADGDCQQIFNMICGHSSFLGLLYTKSKSTDFLNLKCELLNLILLLMETYPKICDDLELPVFLGAYNATLSESDCAILKIIQRCEIETSGEEKINRLALYQPLLWGQAAASKYSTLHNKISKTTRTSEVLQLIEPERMLRSALKFPLQAKLEPSETELVIEHDAAYYDPRFFLPLICHLCSPDAYIDKHLKLIESGVLALVFGSFSSYDSQMRALGCTALSRIYHQMASAKKALSAEKQIWLHLIEVAKNGIAQQIDENDGVPKRVPSIATSFLVRATTIISSPLDPMYKSISSFILAKPSLDMFSVPNFLRLFHSQNIRHSDEDGEKPVGGGMKNVISNTQHITERNWILTVIRDGLRDMLDFNILQQNFVFKILLTYYGSKNGNLRSDASKLIILSILRKSVGIKDKALDLIKRQGFLLWTLDQITNVSERISTNGNTDEYETELKQLIELVSYSWKAVRNMFNNAQIIADEKLTLGEFRNTATNVIILTAKTFTTKTTYLKLVQGMVNIVKEVEQINGNGREWQDPKNMMPKHGIEELLHTCLSSFKSGDNKPDTDYHYEGSIRNEVEKILNSCDIVIPKIDK